MVTCTFLVDTLSWMAATMPLTVDNQCVVVAGNGQQGHAHGAVLMTPWHGPSYMQCDTTQLMCQSRAHTTPAHKERQQ